MHDLRLNTRFLKPENENLLKASDIITSILNTIHEPILQSMPIKNKR